jgi:sulfatase maturation enzyme AslB (radical SAM superfamily)
MATSADGSLRLCCLARQMPGAGLRERTLSAAWNFAGFHEARDRMLQGKSVAGCETCHIEEKGGKKSQRILNNERLGWEINEPRLQSLDLRLGNTCNLQCVMCRPQESSKWNALAKSLAAKASNAELRESMTSNLAASHGVNDWLKGEDWLEDFAETLPTLKEIILGGGEPLLSEKHLSLLEACVSSGHAEHISLRYHTNGTVVDESMFALWKHFALVEMYVSVDGVGERNHYIRYPSKWQNIERNLHLLDENSNESFKFRILKSVQALNMLYLGEFTQWIESQYFKNLRYDGLFLPNIVHDPKYLSVQIYPEKLKRFITNQNLKAPAQIQSLVRFMNLTDESHRLPQFREYISLLDRERGTSFSATFPELGEWLQWEHS